VRCGGKMDSPTRVHPHGADGATGPRGHGHPLPRHREPLAAVCRDGHLRDNAAWNTTINTGSGFAAAYSAAIEPLKVYGSALGAVPADQMDRVRKSYGGIELTDAANLSAIRTIGRLRGNAVGVELASSTLKTIRCPPIPR
jgi:hypothetical protein